MAFINRETDYAIRIIRSLSTGDTKSVPEICKEQHVEKNFAYKIAKKLEKHNLVHIARGKAGGISLDCDLNKYSLYDLMTAVDNVEKVNGCMADGYCCEATDINKCKAHMVFINLQKNIDKELKSISLISLM